jgi:hypothetical protein
VAASEAVSVQSDASLASLEVVISKTDLVPYSAARLCRMLRPIAQR